MPYNTLLFNWKVTCIPRVTDRELVFGIEEAWAI
jgi:hypothetical protein